MEKMHPKDWFAALAMQALIVKRTDLTASRLSELSYDIASKMAVAKILSDKGRNRIQRQLKRKQPEKAND
jgi:hypothetical protein